MSSVCGDSAGCATSIPAHWRATAQSHPLRTRTHWRPDPRRHQEARSHPRRRWVADARPGGPARLHRGPGRREAVTAVAFWHRAAAFVAAHGTTSIRRYLTDNGSCHRSTTWANALVATGTTHKRTRPYTPRTNGKAERSNGTLAREWAYVRDYTSEHERRVTLAEFVNYYNHERPHRTGSPEITTEGVIGGAGHGGDRHPWRYPTDWRGRPHHHAPDNQQIVARGEPQHVTQGVQRGDTDTRQRRRLGQVRFARGQADGRYLHGDVLGGGPDTAGHVGEEPPHPLSVRQVGHATAEGDHLPREDPGRSVWGSCGPT
ncbi:integrase core domain-containing protein [Streptomyces sp. 3214.6]|uniref:integrase core domain-containing protein n=1 Tax=Streptomyces sp. 3214.6 TaxID=1882757 RepID=UPI0009A8E906